MPNQFEIQGSQNPEKPHKAVPLATTKLFTGYWPNAAPYRDAAVPYLYEKFYGASRNDKIAAGLNTEISPRLTLIRRPGNVVWNSNDFTDVTGFYSFRPFLAGVGEQVYVIIDTATGVYIGAINGTPVKTLLYTKASGAGTSRFKGEGNTLYWGDGVSTEKWTWFSAWAASTSYPQGQSILDSNNNIQQSLGYAVQIVSTSVIDDLATITYSGSGTVIVGDSITLYGMTAKPQLNGATVSVLATGTNTFTCSCVTSNYSTTAETGIAVDSSQTASVSGSSLPSFSGTIQSVLLDGTVGWISWGNAVQNMGIVAPTSAPTLSTTSLFIPPQWEASTYYWPLPLIIDSNATPYVWQLTTSGTTDSSVPSGLTTGTPTPLYSGGIVSPTPTTVTDGTAVWTCNSLATRATSTAYTVGQAIAVTWTYSFGSFGGIVHVVTYLSFFLCSEGGVTSSTATTSITWNGGLQSTTVDGGVTWTCIGGYVTRTASASSSPTVGGIINQVAGNVSNSQLVSTDTEVQDSNFNGQLPIVSGVSGASAPTWATTLGAQTPDNSGLIWLNDGTLGAANTGNWFYSFTYVNPATGDESTGSPLSKAILLPASNAVVVSGPGSSDTQVGAINIYRTPQQPTTSVSGTPFLLTQITAPIDGGSWSYTDSTPDPPNPGAILDVLITCPGYAIVNGVVSNYNDPPPTGLTNLEFSAGRMWGTVGNISYYSTGPDVTTGNGNTSWNALNFNETPGTMYKLWPTTVGLFHFTNDGLWLVTGLGTQTNPFAPIQQVDADISIASSNSYATNGTQALVYTSDRIYLQIDPQQGTSWLGQPVATDLIASYDPTETFLTYHSNGLDRVGIITNGSTGWLSWETVPAPETGYLWNPPALLNVGAAGVKAVQSVETSPGIYTLLIGASGTGPILARDSTFSTFTDDGNAYESWAAFGNIVFAHHGQMAGLVHVGSDFVKVGTAPAVSVLLDEILNQPGTPAWSVIPNPVNDPPNLTPSNSLYQLRYWMVQTQEPVYCRVGLFKFDFGDTDTEQNELLCFTVFGISMTEEAS